SDIAHFYDIDVDDVRLTGSAAAFRPPYETLNDVDVVIGVRDDNHLKHIYRQQRNSAQRFSVPLGASVARGLGRKCSSLRWRHSHGDVVCPFFTFASLSPPVIEARETGEWVRGRAMVTDARLGIFNTQFYECSGAIGKLMICSTFGRGETFEGTEF